MEFVDPGQAASAHASPVVNSAEAEAHPSYSNLDLPIPINNFTWEGHPYASYESWEGGVVWVERTTFAHLLNCVCDDSGLPAWIGKQGTGVNPEGGATHAADRVVHIAQSVRSTLPHASPLSTVVP